MCVCVCMLAHRVHWKVSGYISQGPGKKEMAHSNKENKVSLMMGLFIRMQAKEINKG